jgi:amidase
MTRAYMLNVAAGIYAELGDAQRSLGRRASERELEPTTWLFYDIGHRTGADELERSTAAVTAARLALRRFGLRYDVLLTPTLAQPPARIGELLPKPAERALMWTMRRAPLKIALERAMNEMAHGMLAQMPNTQLFNLTGQPAMSLPLHMECGLPIGVQLAGRLGDEATLLRLGAQLEAEMPWRHRRAPRLDLLWTA